MRKIMGLLALLLLPSYAFAQPAVSANPPIGVAGAYNSGAQTCTSGQPCWVQTDINGKLLTSSSSTITGFPTTQTTGTPIAVTTGGVTGTLPSGAVVVAANVGSTNNAYCKLGASATTSDQLIAPTSWFAFTVGAATQLTCITSTSTTTVNMVGGSGIPTGAGGGGGGSGGGAVTIADGADVAEGAKADAACSTDNGTCTVSALLKRGNQNLTTLNTSVTSAIPAGSAIIGKVGIDQTTPGTTNGVAIVGVNGATALAGNGATGTGSPRVTIASDNSAVAGLGAVATGAAPPANAIYLGANASGATGGHVAGLISCDNHVFKHITSATDTLAVQGVASQTIYICGWRSRAAGVATWYLENTASANANCSSTLTQITGVATEAANTGETMLASFWSGLKNTSGNGLCINSTGTGGVDVDIWYTQF